MRGLSERSTESTARRILRSARKSTKNLLQGLGVGVGGDANDEANRPKEPPLVAGGDDAGGLAARRSRTKALDAAREHQEHTRRGLRSSSKAAERDKAQSDIDEAEAERERLAARMKEVEQEKEAAQERLVAASDPDENDIDDDDASSYAESIVSGMRSALARSSCATPSRSVSRAARAMSACGAPP